MLEYAITNKTVSSHENTSLSQLVICRDGYFRSITN